MERIAIALALATLLASLASCDSASGSAATPAPTRPTPVATPSPKPTERPTLVPLPTTQWQTSDTDVVSRPTPKPPLTPGPSPTPRPTPMPRVTANPGPTSTITPYPLRTLPPVPYLKKEEAAELVGRPLTFIFLSWFESELAVAPYQGTYYTFRAKPGYKFVILEYRFKNNHNEEQTTPEPSAADLLTRPKGFIYKLWAPPSGLAADPYQPYLSSPPELAKYGHTTGGNVKLMQEYGMRGRVIFEIPDEMVPAEASLAIVRARLLLE